MLQRDQVRPLAIPSPDPNTVDTESRRKLHSAYELRRRHFVLCCCGCVGVLIVIVGLIALVLALVFKIKEPTLIMNSMSVTKLQTHPDSGLVDFTITADISINNPNDAQFIFGNVTTDFYNDGNKVAVAHGPGGKVGTDRETRTNVTVDVTTEANVTDLTVRTLKIKSYTEIRGSVNVLGIYKKHKTIMLNCTMSPNIDLVTQNLNPACESRSN